VCLCCLQHSPHAKADQVCYGTGLCRCLECATAGCLAALLKDPSGSLAAEHMHRCLVVTVLRHTGGRVTCAAELCVCSLFVLFGQHTDMSLVWLGVLQEQSVRC
jgi:hypothetical protein